MLEQVYLITHGTDPKNYIRGFILSMVESAEDIKNGVNLVKQIFKNYALPVVPLFENQLALTHADTILHESITEEIRQIHLKLWSEIQSTNTKRMVLAHDRAGLALSFFDRIKNWLAPK